MDSSSIILTGVGADLSCNLKTPIYLDFGKDYEIALVALDTYYSIFNVHKDNNLIFYSVDNGGSWIKIEVIPGAYEITDLNNFIQGRIAANVHLKDAISFEPNHNTLRTNLNITNPLYAVKFEGDRSLGTVFGFSPGVYHKSQQGQKSVDIMGINTIFVHTNIISSSYVNDDTQPCLFSFFPSVPYGYRIGISPNNLIYLPVTTDKIRNIRIWLTSQDNEIINLNGETLTVRLHLRSKRKFY